MKHFLNPRSFRLAAIAFPMFALALIGGCGGGGDDLTSMPSTADAVVGAEDVASGNTKAAVGFFRDQEGWQLALTGVDSADVASISVAGVELLPVLGKLIEAGTAQAQVVDKEYFFASSTQPEADGIPTEGVLLLALRGGERQSFPLKFNDLGSNDSMATVQSAAKKQALAINWTAIWNTAKKMAAKAAAHSVIKAYMRSKGYWCPSIGPWWLCARPVS